MVLYIKYEKNSIYINIICARFVFLLVCAVSLAFPSAAQSTKSEQAVLYCQSVIAQLNRKSYDDIAGLIRANGLLVRREYADAFLALAGDYMAKDELLLSRTSGYIAFFLADSLQLPAVRAEAAYHIGHINVQGQAYDEAEKWTQRAVKYYEAQGLINYLLDAYLTIIACNMRREPVRVQHMNDLFSKALLAAVRCQKCPQYVSLLNNYAEFQHVVVGNDTAALETYAKIIELIEDSDNTLPPIIYFNAVRRVSDIKVDAKDFKNRDKVIAIYDKALQRADNLASDVYRMIVYDQLAGFYWMIGDQLNVFRAVENMRTIHLKGAWRQELDEANDDNVRSLYPSGANYAAKLLLAAIASDELQLYDKGIVLAEEALAICKADNLKQFELMCYSKLFDLYFFRGDERKAQENYEACTALFKSFSLEEKKASNTIVDELTRLYGVLYLQETPTKTLRDLAMGYRNSGNGVPFALRLLAKATAADEAANNLEGLILDLEDELLLFVDMGNANDAVQKLHRLDELLNNNDINKCDYFAAIVKREAQERAKLSLLERIQMKRLYPAVQYGMLRYNKALITDSLLDGLLNQAAITITTRRMSRWGNTSNGDLDVFKRAPQFDISKYQDAFLADYALKLLDEENLDHKKYFTYRAAIFTEYAEMYRLLGMQVEFVDAWNKAAKYILRQEDRPSATDGRSSMALGRLWAMSFASLGLDSQVVARIGDLASNDTGLARAQHAMLFMRTIETISYEQQIIEIDSKLRDTRSTDTSMYLILLALKADVYSKNSKYAEAADQLRLTYNLAMEAKDILIAEDAAYKLGDVYSRIDVVEAKKYITEALRLSYLLESDRLKSECHYRLAFLYKNSRDHDKAMDHYEHAIRFAPSKRSDNYANALCQRGYAAVAKKYNFTSLVELLADSASQDTTIARAIGDIRQAISIHMDLGNVSNAGVDHILMAELFQLQNLDSAYVNAQKALEYYNMGTGVDPLKQIHAKLFISQIIWHKISRGEKEIENGIPTMLNFAKEVITGLSDYKKRYKDEDIQLGFVQQYEAALEKCLGICLLAATVDNDADRKWTTYNLCQFIKADILNQSLVVAGTSATAQSLLAEESKKYSILSALNGKLVAEKQKLGEFRNDGILDSVRSEIRKYTNEVTEIRNTIDGMRVEPLNQGDYLKKETQTYLKAHPDEAFLDYFVADSMWFAWLLKDKKIKLFKIDLDVKQVKEYCSLLKDRTTNIDKHFLNLGRYLYDKLLGNVDQELSTIKSLKIIPHGPLHYLPFEALITNTKNGRPEWMIEKKFTMSYGSSISTVLLLNKHYRKNDGRRPASFRGFAKSDFSEGRVRRGASGLPQIKNTINEVQVISLLFKDTITFYENACTESNLKNIISAGVDYLHVASHTLSDDGVSEIVLTPDSVEDGLLNYFELYDIGGHVENVNLSACNTATGKSQSMEGMIGLVRGFHRLGAANIQASLWFVDDKSTSVFMDLFYAHLIRDGLTPSQAMKASKLKMIKAQPTGYTQDMQSYKHPYYWATFINVGRD